jgi:NAD(P)-dependent dehydrogenase (short-subunit alcohol dehydrogenase family)
VGDDLAGDVVRGVAGEIDDETDQIVRHPAMLHRDARVNRLLELLAALGAGRGAALGAERGTAIINLSSIMGLRGYFPDFAAMSISYSTSKAGIIGFTRQVAAEYAKEKIRVNAIAPGSMAYLIFTGA